MFSLFFLENFQFKHQNYLFRQKGNKFFNFEFSVGYTLKNVLSIFTMSYVGSLSRTPSNEIFLNCIFLLLIILHHPPLMDIYGRDVGGGRKEGRVPLNVILNNCVICVLIMRLYGVFLLGCYSIVLYWG